MTEEEILQDNKLIAEFMEYPTMKAKISFADGMMGWEDRIWKFHEDWNLLMGACEKANQLGVDGKRFKAKYGNVGEDLLFSMHTSMTCVDIHGAWLNLVGLIQWHNHKSE